MSKNPFIQTQDISTQRIQGYCKNIVKMGNYTEMSPGIDRCNKSPDGKAHSKNF